jgi:hypothetical protein
VVGDSAVDGDLQLGYVTGRVVLVVFVVQLAAVSGEAVATVVDPADQV